MEDDSKSYLLPSETMPQLHLSHHLDDLVEFREFLSDRRIFTKNTRIERYTEYLKQIVTKRSCDPRIVFKNSIEGPFENPTDWMQYVLREVHELMWILNGLKSRLPTGIDEKLRIIVGGSDFAALDMDSQARDAQFELRIASYFCQAGCKVDLSTETDIIAFTPDQAFYLECKRVASPGQLEKRLSEAKKQLNIRMPKRFGSRGVFGLVVADVTKVAFPHNGLTWALTNQHSKDVMQQKLQSVALESVKPDLFRDCSNIIDCWLQIHIPSLIIQLQMTGTRFSSLHTFKDNGNREEWRAIKSFIKIFESGSKGDKREIPPVKLTPRSEIDFPKGTVFELTDGLLKEILEVGAFGERKLNEVVGAIIVEGKTHKFSIFDLQLISEKAIEEARSMLSTDPVRAQIHLLMLMYSYRFPFEESSDGL